MITLTLKITPMSSLSLNFRKPYGLFYETLKYIPGSMIQGALGGKLLERCSQKSFLRDHRSCPDRTRCLFFTSHRRWIVRNCYPSVRGGPNVFPATAKVCKTNGEDHGVWDVLIPDLCYGEHLDRKGGLSLPNDLRCPYCFDRLDGIAGFYEYGGGGRPKKIEPNVRRLARTAISRRRRTAEDGMLYSLEVLDGTALSGCSDELMKLSFVGSMVTGEEHVDEMVTELEGITRIGGGYSRGLGHVKVEVTDRKSVNEALKHSELEILTRLKAFNKRIDDVSAYYSRLFESPRENSHYFAITLRSNVSLHTVEDGVRRPTTLLRVDDLKKELSEAGSSMNVDAPVPELELLLAYASHELESGWSTAHGLPKEVCLSTKMGSVYVFGFKGDIENLARLLSSLEVRGVGENRAQGFGEITVCDPFHHTHVLEVK